MAATSHESDSHPAILEKLCLGFLQALVTEKIGFKFHISSGDFVCSLDFNGAGSPTQTRSPTVKVKRKSPSTRKRNADRRRLFLENKKRNGPIPVDTDQVRSAAASPAQVKARESQLDKVPEAEEREGRKRTGDRLAWINGQPALVPVTVDIASVYPEASLDLNPRPIHLQQENSGGSAESLDTSSDPSRDEIVEVTEFMQVKPHPWPLERARVRYAARTGNTGREKRHIEARLRNDHHPSDLSQGSQVVQAQEGRSLHRLGAYRDVPADQVSYIGHGALAHSEADKRRQRKSPHKSGDFPESNMNDQSLILQTCLDHRANGATN